MSEESKRKNTGPYMSMRGPEFRNRYGTSGVRQDTRYDRGTSELSIELKIMQNKLPRTTAAMDAIGLLNDYAAQLRQYKSDAQLLGIFNIGKNIVEPQLSPGQTIEMRFVQNSDGTFSEPTFAAPNAPILDSKTIRIPLQGKEYCSPQPPVECIRIPSSKPSLTLPGEPGGMDYVPIEPAQGQPQANCDPDKLTRPVKEYNENAEKKSPSGGKPIAY